MQTTATLADVITQWRTLIKSQQSALKADFYQHLNPQRQLKKLTQNMDALLCGVWQECGLPSDVCLIAVGGYGRCELFPHSDVDVLILLPNECPEALSTQVEALIGLMWDIGLNVGHSVRTISDCVAEAKQDATVMTNLLEARLLAGKKEAFLSYQQAVKTALQPADFLAAKIKEQDNRHAKFNDTEYNLEPSLKESPGGLRDLHTMLWLAQSQQLGSDWASLHKNGLISAQELRELRRHERNLQSLRIRLHYLANRREDRLLFDFQNELASELGFVNTPKKRASEQLMQSFYRSAKFISLMNEILLKDLANRLQKPQKTTPINTHFYAQNHLLEANQDGLFKAHPEAILLSFLSLQQHPELTGMGAGLIRQLQGAKGMINREFRANLLHQRLFLDILQQADGVHQTLRRMNHYGVLGRYIPAFGKIIGQMQHDLFHVYTVDEHTLRVLGNLRRFAKPELKHEFPLCSQLFASFEKPHLLYLAAIFHDIAKGRGGDHSVLGTRDAIQFCKLHDLPIEDTALITWLVNAHLMLSKTAQKSDLSDPEVITQFAQFVRNEIRLTALYLLTVADIRGTSPAVWNDWKANLLQQLFTQTKHLLQGASNTALVLQARQQEAEKKLTNFGLRASSYQTLWQTFGDDYFARYEADEIAWQSRLLTPHLHSPKPIVRAKLSGNGDGIQVMIYTKDQDDLFARICNFFDQMAYNIAQAKIFTTKHGYALNQFIILNQEVKLVSYSGLLKYIEVELSKLLAEEKAPNSLLAPQVGRVKRQVKFTPFTTTTHLHTQANSNQHLVEIITADRPGLLANIAQLFLKHQIALHNAKINTLGHRVEDHFIVSAKQNAKLSAAQIKQLSADLQAL